MSPELFTNRECIPVASPLDARDTHPSKTGLGGAPGILTMFARATCPEVA